MKINNTDNVKNLIKMSMKHGMKDTNEAELTIYSVGDVTAIFETNSDGKPKFYGFVFEALGRDFIITPTFDLVTTVIDEEGEEESYDITDENFIESLEKFLEWRLETLSKLEI